MEELALISFKIISAVGQAKSSYIEAMKLASNGEFTKAYEKIEIGDQEFIKGHESHAEMIQSEARGENIVPSILLMHAEDQLMAAETVKIMALEIIRLNKRVIALEQ